MNPVMPSFLRAAMVLALSGMAVGSCLAQTPPSLPAAPAQSQTPPPAQTGATQAPAVEPTIQRIRTEDSGSRIDELRVGGETQSITVQPKIGGRVPYEVKPPESARGNAPSPSSGDTNGSRVWNVLKF